MTAPLIPAAELEPTPAEMARAQAALAKCTSVRDAIMYEAGAMSSSGRGLADALTRGDARQVAWIVRDMRAISLAVDERLDQLAATPAAKS